MPPKVRGLLFLSATAFALAANAFAQQQPSEPPPSASSSFTNAPPTATATAAPVVLTTQDRLLKARGMIAARQLSSAAFELEKIKKESGDNDLQSVVRTMLVGVYLEQPNYERAKDLLTETFERSKNRKNGTENIYLPVAGQVIKGAENQLERYKRLGFNLSDPKLPAEAVTDLDRWRKMLETIIEQTKQMSADEKRSAESLAVLEEAANARAALARDNYEAAAWHNAMDDTREMIANAQTKVTDVDGAAVDMKNVVELKLPVATDAASSDSAQTPVLTLVKSPLDEKPISQITVQTNNSAANNGDLAKTKIETGASVTNKARSQTTEKSDSPRTVNIVKADLKVADDDNLMKVGSLVDMATRKFPPSYPPSARTARIAGVVKVEVVIDEEGSVAEVKTSEGPELLRRAATEAVKRWKFKPATRDGQSVRMSGFVNFNFTL